MGVTLKAHKRNNETRSILRKVRQSGKVPAIVYGKGTDNLPIAVDEVEMTKVLRDEGNYAVLKLDVEDGVSYQVMVYEVQKDPIKDSLLHIDFKTIRMDEPVDSEVTIEVTGEAEGVKDGGILQQSLRTLEIRSLPDARPDTIVCEVDSLKIGDSLTVADLNIPEGVEVLSNMDETVVSIVAPAQEEPTVPEGQTGEPELVEKTEGDGEGEQA